MPELHELIDTVVVVMMENRSFDHMLGHLSLSGLNSRVDGLKSPLNQDAYTNIWQGGAYNPHAARKDRWLRSDIPHEHNEVAKQMATSPITGDFTMSGFVEAYVDYVRAKSGDAAFDPGLQPDPMMYFTPRYVPITSFLAQQFCVCDGWFCPIPTSTTPNKTVAISGGTPIHDTKTRLIRNVENMIFDWLKANGIRWRVYHDGLSFFALYPAAWDDVLGPNFRDFEFLSHDFLLEPKAEFPSVVFVEPSYESVPHVSPDQPNDNHAPLPVGFGEEFLRRTYAAVRINPERWARTVLVITYDEHGGFWDHVAPPRIPLTTTGPDVFHFESLGPRVPGIVVSPLVERGSVCSKPSTTPHCSNSWRRCLRRDARIRPRWRLVQVLGIDSVAACITREAPRPDRPPPPGARSRQPLSLRTRPLSRSTTFTGRSVRRRLNCSDSIPREAGRKYPELIDWQRSLADP